ncbi:MAG: hypothetical protein DRJ47_04895 [Thermoprotei archaeon]|nr:MAG: hypothetical protein DRJ47_04895 [Thermoprotei archaeon]
MPPISYRNEFRKTVQQAEDILRKINDILSEMNSIFRRVKESERFSKRGGLDEATFKALRDEALREACTCFLKYLDFLEEAKVALQDLKVVHAKAMLQLDEARKGRSIGAERSDYYTILRGRLKEIAETIESLNKVIKGLNSELFLFLLESYVEKALELNGLDKASRVMELAREFGDKWSDERLRIESELSSLDSRIEELNEKLREIEVRFALGEYDKSTFEEKRLAVERELEKIVNERDAKERMLEERDARFLRALEKLEVILGEKQ